MRSKWQPYMFWIFIAFLAISSFYPVVGIVAIVCMIAPIGLAVQRGRWWCGNACPRGSFYDHVVSRISPHKKTPAFFRHPYFRGGMVVFIFLMFGLQLRSAWGSSEAIGMVFLLIIGVTTLIAVLLALIYDSRTWCNFCPMGTLAMLVSRLRR